MPLVALLAAALWFLSLEYRWVYALAAGRQITPDALEAQFSLQGLPASQRATRSLVTACATQGLSQGYSPEAGQETAAICARIVAGVLAQSPAHGRALATRLVLLGNAITPQAYADAAAAAPWEPWPLGMRIVATTRVRPLPADIEPLLLGDIARAMRSDWGRQMLAELYLRGPGLRPLVLSASDGLSEREKARFLAEIRKRVGEDG